MKLESLLQQMMMDDIIDMQIVSNQRLISWQECDASIKKNTRIFFLYGVFEGERKKKVAAAAVQI